MAMSLAGRCRRILSFFLGCRFPWSGWPTGKQRSLCVSYVLWIVVASPPLGLSAAGTEHQRLHRRSRLHCGAKLIMIHKPDSLDGEYFRYLAIVNSEQVVSITFLAALSEIG